MGTGGASLIRFRLCLGVLGEPEEVVRTQEIGESHRHDGTAHLDEVVDGGTGTGTGTVVVVVGRTLVRGVRAGEGTLVMIEVGYDYCAVCIFRYIILALVTQTCPCIELLCEAHDLKNENVFTHVRKSSPI